MRARSKHFIDLQALRVHLKSKIHRRRVKELRVEPYTQAEAEAAAGIGQFVAAKKVDVPMFLGQAAMAALSEFAGEAGAGAGGDAADMAAN